VEQGQTLRQVVLDSLARGLEGLPSPDGKAGRSFWEKRELLPAYKAALKAGAFSEGPDSTDIISEDRSAREDALL
jgi:hypothetical protein